MVEWESSTSFLLSTELVYWISGWTVFCRPTECATWAREWGQWLRVKDRVPDTVRMEGVDCEAFVAIRCMSKVSSTLARQP